MAHRQTGARSGGWTCGAHRFERQARGKAWRTDAREAGQCGRPTVHDPDFGFCPEWRSLDRNAGILLPRGGFTVRRFGVNPERSPARNAHVARKAFLIRA